MPRLKQRYTDEAVSALMNEFGYTNIMQVPLTATFYNSAGEAGT